MTQYRPNTLRRVVAALPRRFVGTSAQVLYYSTVLAVIYQVYAGDFSAIPWITASPILARLLEAVGGNLLSGVLERVARDEQMAPEDILFRIEEALEGMSEEMRETLSLNTHVLTLIYRLLLATETTRGALPEELAALADLAQPAAVLIPRTPHLLARIGHEAELRRMMGWLQEIEREDRGRAVFLLGPVGSGRSAFAADLRAAAVNRGYRTAAIRFSPSETESVREVNDFLRLGRKSPHVQAIFEAFPATARQAVHRQWTDLMIQLSEAGASSGAAGVADQIETLGRFVRSSAHIGPLVITLDNLDWAPGYWIDLLPPIMREIGRDLPVLLLVSLESPAPLDQLHGPLHTEPTRLAQKMAGEATAATYFFNHVDYDDIARYIHPATGELASRLLYLSGGDPKTVEIIWQEWVAREAVTRDATGRWAVDGPDERWWVFGDAADHARELLEEALDDRDDEPPYSLEEIEAFLNCAALEGETFTIRAVAQALDVDADELSDFLDDFLLAYEDPGEPGRIRPGVLEDAGFTKVDEFRELYQYRFARPYLHHVWAKYPAAPERLAEWQRALPGALEGLYYPYGFRIAGKLARLFAEAGLADKAAEYRRFGRAQQSLEELRRFIQPMLEAVPANKFEAYRLFDAGFAFLNKLITERSDLWPEAVGVARRLGALGRCCEDWEYEARANRLMGWALGNGGKPRRGLFWVRRGAALFPRNGVEHLLDLDFSSADLEALDGLSGNQRQDQLQLAAFDATTGALLQDMGDLPGARPYFERALAIFERVLGPDHPDTGMSYGNLAGVFEGTGDYLSALPLREKAIKVHEKVFGEAHPITATSFNNMGALLRAMGDLPAARPYLERALAICERVLGPDHPDTAQSLNNMGFLLQAMGDLPAARPYYERALAICERVLGPDHPDTAGSLNNMGYLLDAMDEDEAGLEYYLKALGIQERVLGPDHPDTAQSLHNTGALLVEMGRIDEGRPLLERSLAIRIARLGENHPDTRSTRAWLRAL
jgi:tetratricopeptide (TPR) repeat protein